MTPLEKRDAEVAKIEESAKMFVGDANDDLTARLRLAYIAGGLGAALLAAYYEIEELEQKCKKQNRGRTEA